MRISLGSPLGSSDSERAVTRRGQAGNHTVQIVGASMAFSGVSAAIQGLLKT